MTTTVDPLLALTTMTDTGCLPCQARAAAAEHERYETAPAPTRQRWSGVIGIEGEVTGDGRLIERNALRWEDLPLPFRYVASDSGEHDGAVVVGRITAIHRSGGEIRGEGDFDSNSPDGLEAIRQVKEGLTTGVSMDLDDVSFEVRIAAELMDEDPLLGLLLASEDDGPEVDEDGRVKVMESNSEDEVRVTTSGRIRAATIVAIPAFANARIALDGGTEAADPDPDQDPVELVAAAAPLAPPARWFSDPHFAGPQPLTVAADGRVSGHLALWGTCHVSHTAQGQCVPPPHSATRYSHFHTGAVLTEDGAEVPVGHITLDTLHASATLTPASTLAHYENTGTVVADVAAGEDRFGIWVAGALRPWATPEQVRSLRSAPLSGDWRRIAGSLELVAALAVNVPGFPVPRPSGLVAGGVVQSLVASGMLPPARVRRPGTEGALSLDDLRYLKRLADRERAEESALLAAGSLPSPVELARRVRASALSMRAHAH